MGSVKWTINPSNRQRFVQNGKEDRQKLNIFKVQMRYLYGTP